MPWLKIVALTCLGLAACAQQQTQDPAVAAAEAPEYGTPINPELFAAVSHRWVAAGLPQPGAACTLPNTVLADAQMFVELCGKNAPGANACQRHSLIVVVDGWQLERHRMQSTLAHEIAHWLAECTGAATARQNVDHSLEGVWFSDIDGDDFVIAPWVR